MSTNPIKGSQLVEDDGAIKKAITEMESLRDVYTKTLDTISSQAKELMKSLDGVNNSTKEGRETTNKALSDAEKLKKEQKAYVEALNDTNTKIRELRAAKTQAIKVQKLEQKAAESAEGSYNKLSAQYSLNKLRLNAMSKAERDATKQGQLLEKQTNEIYQEMKRLQEATGKHVLSVGDYEKGWKGVAGGLEDVGGASGVAVGGLTNLGKSASALAKNPVVLAIAAIVGGLAALYSLFKKTKAGSDLLAKGGAILDGVLSSLVGIVDNLYSGLMSAFEDPQQAMADMWASLKKNIVNRFVGVIDLVKAVSKGFKALWDRDLQGVKDAAGDAGTALLKMNTGLDGEQQKEFAQSIRDTTKAIQEQATAFAKLEEQRLKTRRSNRELEKSLEDLITKEELAKAIADDSTRSFKDREDAAKRASELTQQRALVEKRIAKANLDVINREIDLRSKNGENIEDLLDEQLSAYQTLKQANRDYLLTVADNEKRENELKQDRLERDLDILIDGFDNQKTINERIIADDNKTLAERKAKLDETRVLFEDSFAKQIETIQKFTGVQLNANDLINESDSVALNQKIRSLGLSEIMEGRLLEVIRDRRTATQDLNDAEQLLNDAKAKQVQESIQLEQSGIDQRYEYRLSEIEAMKDTEAEKTKLRLEAEKERLQAILKLNQLYGGLLTNVQVKTIENTIKAIQNEINNSKDPEQKDIYDLVGLKLDDQQKQAISENVAFTVSNIQSILAAQVEAADVVVQKRQEETTAAQSRYDAEIEARNNGYANSVETSKKELEDAQANEEKALKEKEKYQKAQDRIDTVMQTGSLITATANIWKSLSGVPFIGPALALAAIGTMWGSFAASKIKAKSVTKETYGTGGYEVLQGGSHASGNDIPIGTTTRGNQRTAEGGEGLAIFRRTSTKKYGKELPKIVDSINKGVFEKTYANAFVSEDMPMVVNAGFGGGYDTADLSNVEGELTKIREQGEEKHFVDERGRRVVKYKNITRIYE